MMEVFLKDISKIAAGNSAPKKDDFSNEGIPFVRAGSLAFLTKYESLDKCEKITESVALKKRLKLFKKGSILFAKSGMSSKMGRIYQLTDDAYVVSHLAIIEVDKVVANPSFIKYFFILRPPFFLIRDDAYPSIKLEDIKNITLNLPDLPTQNKIVALLDKASALAQKRDNSIALLDELLRAQFLEMFGDPVLNPKGWEMQSFSHIGKFQSGGTPSKKNDKYWLGDFPWVSPKDMKRELINDSIDHISETVFEETALKKIPKHNVLIVVRGMILAHSFPVALSKRSIAINQDMKAIQLTNKYNPFFALTCLIAMKKWILKFVSTAGHGTKKISSESLEALKIIIPPIELQNQFETIYHKIQAQKDTLSQSKTELENLYNGLLQRAFKGELGFNVDLKKNTKTEMV